MVSFEYMGFDVEASIISGDTCATDRSDIHYGPYIDELTVNCNGHDVTELLSDSAIDAIADEAVHHGPV